MISSSFQLWVFNNTNKQTAKKIKTKQNSSLTNVALHFSSEKTNHYYLTTFLLLALCPLESMLKFISILK